jgi:hypothetical protein
VLVRFPCGECGKRLKARVPAGTRKISTVCTACKVRIVANVNVGGAGQEAQAGRARHTAGGGQSRQMGRMMGGGAAAGGGGACEAQCTCTAAQRKLIVRHPLRQMQRLLDESSARLAG